MAETTVTLICKFVESIPPVNNVTFFENGDAQWALRVCLGKNIQFSCSIFKSILLIK